MPGSDANTDDPLIENEVDGRLGSRPRMVSQSTRRGDRPVASLSPMFHRLLESRTSILSALAAICRREAFACEAFGFSPIMYIFPEVNTASESHLRHSLGPPAIGGRFVESPTRSSQRRGAARRETLARAVRMPISPYTPKYREDSDIERERQLLLTTSLSCTFSGFVNKQMPPTTISPNVDNDRRAKPVDTVHRPAAPPDHDTDGQFQLRERSERRMSKRIDSIKETCIVGQGGYQALAAVVRPTVRLQSTSAELLSILNSLQLVTVELVEVYISCTAGSRRGDPTDFYGEYIRDVMANEGAETMSLCSELAFSLPMNLKGNLFISQNFLTSEQGAVILGLPNRVLRFPSSTIGLDREVKLYKQLGMKVEVC